MAYSLLAKSINQVIYCFLTNRFTFLTKVWMLQVKKSHFCGISEFLEFQVLFYEWNLGINNSFHFFGVFV